MEQLLFNEFRATIFGDQEKQERDGSEKSKTQPEGEAIVRGKNCVTDDARQDRRAGYAFGKCLPSEIGQSPRNSEERSQRIDHYYPRRCAEQRKRNQRQDRA